MRTLSLVVSAATMALMLQCGSVLASKPSYAQEQSQERDKDKKKEDARHGHPTRDYSDRRTAFTAVDVRDRDRDDDRRQTGWQGDPRYRDRWQNDRDRDNDHDADDRGRNRDNDHDADDRWRDRDNDHDADDRWRDRDNDHDADDRWRDQDRYGYSDQYNRYRYDRYPDRNTRYYAPQRDYIVYQLPPRYRVAQYSGTPYYYGDGSWYSPYGSGYRMVSPPIGMLLSFLPEVYQTLMFGNVPFYRANDVYYRWMPQDHAYMVTRYPGTY